MSALREVTRAERAQRMATVTPEEMEADLARDAQGKFAHARRASAISPVSITWAWRGMVPLGALSLLYGPEGLGKSSLAAMVAAMVTRGTLSGDLEGKPANVEIVAYEDDAGAVLVPRLEAAGADLNRVWIHAPESDPLTLPDDVEAFGNALEARGTKLVIVDPLPDALREGLKDNNNGDVRSALVPLNAMAQRLDLAILGVTHPNKGATDAANKVMGSRAFRSVPRSVLLYGRDPDDLAGPSRIVAVSKANYAGKTSRKVKVTSVAVDGVKGTHPRAAIAGESRYTDDDLMVSNAGGARVGGSKAEQAERLIAQLLEDGGGKIKAEVAYAAGAAQGISEATMKRARQSIGATGGPEWKLDALPL